VKGGPALHSDRIKWNRKYRSRRAALRARPSEIVCTSYHLAPHGCALDIAAGNGRNALFLAQKGFTVEALDISEAGLKMAAGRDPKVRAACVDLDVYDIVPRRYSLVLNIRYLNRRLFPQIFEALIGGGVLVFETYLKHPNFVPQRPHRDDHLLRINELLLGFLKLEVVYYSETTVAAFGEPYPMASLVAIKR
jgi:tellurite methyltransferase